MNNVSWRVVLVGALLAVMGAAVAQAAAADVGVAVVPLDVGAVSPAEGVFGLVGHTIVATDAAVCGPRGLVSSVVVPTASFAVETCGVATAVVPTTAVVTPVVPLGVVSVPTVSVPVGLTHLQANVSVVAPRCCGVRLAGRRGRAVVRQRVVQTGRVPTTSRLSVRVRSLGRK